MAVGGCWWWLVVVGGGGGRDIRFSNSDVSVSYSSAYEHFLMFYLICPDVLHLKGAFLFNLSLTV